MAVKAVKGLERQNPRKLRVISVGLMIAGAMRRFGW
jgi:hypothetical protein